jgi:signal transduction histidine kinase
LDLEPTDGGAAPRGAPAVDELAELARDVCESVVETTGVRSAAVLQAETGRWRVLGTIDGAGFGLVPGDVVGSGELRWTSIVESALARHHDLPNVLGPHAPVRRSDARDDVDIPQPPRLPGATEADHLSVVGAPPGGLPSPPHGATPSGTALVGPITLRDGVLVGAVVALDRRDVELQPSHVRLLDTLARCLAVAYEELWTARELEAAQDVADERSHRHQRLLSEVAHDLRTPLAVIAGMAELIERFPEDRARTAVAARSIGANALRLAAMVDGLLDAEARDAGHLTERPERIELTDLLSDIAAETRHLVSGRPIAVTFAGGGEVVAYPSALRRLLVNLAANAVRNTREGTVEIRSEEQDGGVLISVRDTGRGMSAAEVGRFLETYGRGEDSAGFGLGLTIVRRLARVLGATFEIDSVPGAGTTVRTFVPAAGPEPTGRGGASRLFI